MPLSGGDRKHYACELRRVESLQAALVKMVEAAHGVAEKHLRLAHRLERKPTGDVAFDLRNDLIILPKLIAKDQQAK